MEKNATSKTSFASGDGTGSGVRRIVSSERLVSEKSPELSGFEFDLIIASKAFGRWMMRCMAGARGVPHAGLLRCGGEKENVLIGDMARLLRTLSGRYDQGARAASSI